MRMSKHSQEAALKNAFELTSIPFKCPVDMIPVMAITFTLYRYFYKVLTVNSAQLTTTLQKLNSYTF